MLVTIDPKPPPPVRWPLLRTGFRPFFLLAALWGGVAMPLWNLGLAGQTTGAHVSPMWHGHAMMSGFTMAVLAGFLLTAVQNWTGQKTARGVWLAGLAGLWIGARIMGLLKGLDPLQGVLDLLFVSGLALAIARPIARTKNTRNAPFVVVLLAWAMLDGMVHQQPGHASWALARQVDLAVWVMVVITGRIVPGFTNNALSDATVRRFPMLEKGALWAVTILVVASLLKLPAPVLGSLAMVAGLLVVARSWGWQAWQTRHNPLLWVLHLGHLWLGVGLILQGGAAFALWPATLGLHALTTGAVGTLVVGMMTRVALGHTGRPLKAPVLAVVAYGLITIAAITRLTAAAHPSATLWTIAGLAFAASLVAFLIPYAPILWSPRADGARE